MKTVFLLILLLSTGCSIFAQSMSKYHPLDPAYPVDFDGSTFTYNNKKVKLGPQTFFIDGQLSDQEAARFPFVFNSINEAVKHLTPGTEEKPMKLYVAPYVYWIDNPDDPAIRTPKEGESTPYGLEINCDWLQFYGLNPKAENVVLACNRGQTIGAKGNFTMLKILGDGIRTENITFGNYCNVDLVYSLKSELGRKKRASAIVQAQLIHCNGDKIVARNTRFISRLNLCPFTGAKRILFDSCHFECTDDALCGTGVYLNSSFVFFSSKPFYHTTGTGAVFLNCNIKSLTGGSQYFTKAGGQVTVVDTQIDTGPGTYIGWRDIPSREMRHYQYDVFQNGQPVEIDKNNGFATVEMADQLILKAYRFTYKGKVYYNTYNLLQGKDDWDPMEIKQVVLAKERETSQNLRMLPVQMKVTASKSSIETNKTKAELSVTLFRFDNIEVAPTQITWTVSEEDEPYVHLEVNEKEHRCTVIPTNASDKAKDIMVIARTPSGVEAASVITVLPEILNAPGFKKEPVLVKEPGKVEVNYQINGKYEDRSKIKWYRCTDRTGNGAIEVATAHDNTPLRKYLLNAGDIGYYIMTKVTPKHQRSLEGGDFICITNEPVKAEDVLASGHALHSRFENMPTENQKKVLPGFWTLDHFDAPDHGGHYKKDTLQNAWYFGTGKDGAALNTGLIQSERSALLLYTPVEKKTQNMEYTLVAAPFKSAGQGFSVAGMYMDVAIKFDAKSMTGYALRLIRTTKYGNAVDCYFVSYKDGKATKIGETITTSSYRSPCIINLKASATTLYASIHTSAHYEREHYPEEVRDQAELHTTIEKNDFGGFGVLYNGGAPTVFKEVSVKWIN